MPCASLLMLICARSLAASYLPVSTIPHSSSKSTDDQFSACIILNHNISETNPSQLVTHSSISFCSRNEPKSRTTTVPTDLQANSRQISTSSGNPLLLWGPRQALAASFNHKYSTSERLPNPGRHLALYLTSRCQLVE